MATTKAIELALAALQKEEDAWGLDIVNIVTDDQKTEVIVTIDDNPLIPQAVFAVMECFIAGGAQSVDWVGSADKEGVDLVASMRRLTKRDVVRILDSSYKELDLGQEYHDIRITDTRIEVDVTLNIGPTIKGTVAMEMNWALKILQELK